MKIYLKETIGNASTELEMECENEWEAVKVIKTVFEGERMVENTLHPNYKNEQEDL